MYNKYNFKRENFVEAYNEITHSRSYEKIIIDIQI